MLPAASRMLLLLCLLSQILCKQCKGFFEFTTLEMNIANLRRKSEMICIIVTDLITSVDNDLKWILQYSSHAATNSASCFAADNLWQTVHQLRQ